MEWTLEQQQVIESKNENLLVSAAAGSGKTAVLIAHILHRLQSPSINIDQFLVVTFTKAAALEMRTRLYDGLLKLSESHPEDMHIRKQLKLLPQAEVSTIDSFCTRIIQGHFAEIDLDPSFRVGDESEMALLQEDVMNALLEEAYTNEDESFLNLTEALASGKEDSKVSDTILKIYRYSMSQADPDEWMRNCEAIFEIQEKSELKISPFYAYYQEIFVNSEKQKAKSACRKKSSKRDEAGTLISDDEILLELSQYRPLMFKLFELVRTFASRLKEAKEKGKVFEFSDLSHYALQILRKDGEPTETAKELARHYEEILIDEYQDSNDLQEALLTAVSKVQFGEPNIFMVGDMKQSIYRFRNARPELFVEKYNTYGDCAPNRKIELSKNFRSRKEILAAVNEIFTALMHQDIGHIDYTEETSLHPIENIFEGDGEKPELILLKDPEANENLTDKEKEITWIANRILALTDTQTGLMVRTGDKDHPAKRRATYQDIAILLRSTNAFESEITEIFGKMNIPVTFAGNKGFFDHKEIKLVINLLSVLDNCLNDIPVVAVLHSVLFQFSDEELAELEVYRRESIGKKVPFIQILKAYDGTSADIKEKRDLFFRKIELYTKKAVHMDLESLLRFIYADTKIVEYVAAMPDGLKRVANLENLLTKARDFEKTQYHGIFQFLRYIEKKKKQELDRDDAETVLEDDNAVKVMTIHKSKGLQFPIVFLAGTGSTINASDSTQAPFLDNQLGCAIRLVDVEKRIKRNSAYEQAVRHKIKLDNLGEELRILYVALTRAEEKLIITGIRTYKEEEIAAILAHEPDDVKDYASVIENSSSYLDMLWQISGALDEMEIHFPDEEIIRIENPENVTESNQKVTPKEKISRIHEASAQVSSLDLAELENRIHFDYHQDDLYQVLQTMSVSLLKAKALEEKKENQDLYVVEKSVVKDMPKEEAQKIHGAQAGTLYHRIMEHVNEKETAIELLNRLENEGLILPEEKDTINQYKIEAFRQSLLGKRFFTALSLKKAFREKQFIIGVFAKEVFPKYKVPDDELVMLQGVIDMYFEEEDGMVLVDYKTDHVKNEQYFIDQYQLQLNLYEKAIEKITGKPVKEKWIYSFELEKGIRI